MKILQVCHHFLPRHRAGVEVYTDGVARALQGRGHEVTVLTTDDDGTRRPWSLRREEQDGLPVISIAHPRIARSPDDSLGRQEVNDAFARALDETQPDVVHFQHLMYIGLDAPALVRARGVRSVMTLHEYWLLCARGGQMRRTDGVVCEQAEAGTCARCLQDFRFGRTPGEARIAGACSWVRRLTGWDPFPSLKRVKERRQAQKPHTDIALRHSHGEGMLKWLSCRTDRVRALWDAVDRFLCPSRFLMETFVRDGWPVDRMSWSPYGIPMIASESPLSPPPHARLRIGFIGTITPAKGTDVVARAHALLPRGKATLSIWGSGASSPAYAAGVRAALVPGEAEFAGAFAAGRAADALAGLDVLVVPSTWYKNAPLVISEAFRNGVPVVASRLGGMAEMVTDGVDGYLFDPGSAEDLARVLLTLVEDREALARLRSGITSPRTVDDDAGSLEALYRELAGAPA